MLTYKSKNDIPYFKFKEFSPAIDGKDSAFILAETKRIFNPKNLEEFSKALEMNKPPRLRYALRIDFKTAGEFIDADTFFSETEYKDFFKSVLKPRYLYKNINFDKISLADAEFYFSKFKELKEQLKTEYEYLYNPPVRVSENIMSARSIEQASFSEHYGPYIEMAYAVMKGDFTKFEEVMSWDLHRFLFQAEYLIRKRDIENLK